MKEENLTQKFLAELLSGTTNGKDTSHTDHTKNPSKTDRVQTSESKNDKEAKLRKIINFGSGFYSIAEAHAVTRIGESFIRKWIGEGRLTLLTFPDGKREYISGIELTEVVLQHNLDKLNGKV